MDTATLTAKFKGRFPLIEIVLDGWGIGAKDHTDAIFNANTPIMNNLLQKFPNTTLLAHGLHVGLPAEKDLGGSEVGHLTLGAGQILDQGPTAIKNMIDSGDFFKSPELNILVDKCLKHQTPLHLLGLLSDGNIHSHIDHFVAIIEYAFRSGIKQLYVHALLDGRDVPIQSALEYTERLEKLFHQLNAQKPGNDYAFASGGGREIITMDRDEDWRKIQAGWEIHVHGKCGHRFNSIEEAIIYFREAQPGIIDQAIPGFVLVRNGKPIGPILDHHALIFVNFRADRAIEFSHAVLDENFPHFDRSPRPNIEFAGMMIYDQDALIPPNYVVGSVKVDKPFGRRMVELGIPQFRLAETQKYAHVTFFYNGGYREPLDAKQEEYILIDSDKIQSFDTAPQMQADKIASKAVELILAGRFRYGLINFANADMVGHSGNFKATVAAVEATDRALGRVLQAIEKMGGLAVITADHGNADQMQVFNKAKNAWEPNTKHTLNPVPFILYDPLYKGDYQLKVRDKANVLNLSHVAATNFILLGLPVPADLNPPLFLQ